MMTEVLTKGPLTVVVAVEEIEEAVPVPVVDNGLGLL